MGRCAANRLVVQMTGAGADPAAKSGQPEDVAKGPQHGHLRVGMTACSTPLMVICGMGAHLFSVLR